MSAPQHPASRESAGLSLFTVTVAGPGNTRWGVIVRTSDAESAASMTAARGHEVLSVRPGIEKADLRPLPPVICLICSYDLKGLPVDPAGRCITCPECGAINLPQSRTQAVFRSARDRRRVGRFVALGVIVLFVLLMALLLR